MMKKIYSFYEYLKEQETKDDTGILGNLTAGGIASAMMSAAFKKLGFEDKDFSRIDETPETKESKPHTSCGGSPYEFKPIKVTNQKIMSLFKDPAGVFSRDVRYADISKEINSGSKKLFILGVRENLEIKEREGDKFIDKIAIIDPSKPDEIVKSYQATTVPSVPYYSDPKRALNSAGVAIMQPGVVQYRIGIHKKGSPTEHEALVQDGEMEINRYRMDNPKLETYQPGNPDTGSGYGINIHRSSKERGVCVGPYSAGCQVFADGDDFNNFMSVLKSSTENGGKFLYVLIENDDFKNKGNSEDETSQGSSDIEREEEFKSTAEFIRNELNKFDSDEEAIVNSYNEIIKSKKDARDFNKMYRKENGVDIITDLKRALDSNEIDSLKYR